MRSGPGSVRPEADQAVEYQALEECLPAAVEVAQAAAGQGLEAVGRGRLEAVQPPGEPAERPGEQAAGRRRLSWRRCQPWTWSANRLPGCRH